MYLKVHIEEEVKDLALPCEDGDIVQRFLSLDRKLSVELGGNTSGATCVSAFVKTTLTPSGRTYVIKVANIGDSRAVLIRKGEVLNATVDHKPSDPKEKARIEKAGGFVSQGNPPRLDGVLSLSRAFGDFQYKQELGLPPQDQKVSVEPDVYTWHAEEGDMMILACDGVFDVLSNSDLAQTATQYVYMNKHDLGAASGSLLEKCLGLGSCDNMTAMIIVFTSGIEHLRDDELCVGDFSKESNDIVRNGYIQFASMNGFELSDPPQTCQVCSKLFKNMFMCPCKEIVYCGRQCQRNHWKEHKAECAAAKGTRTQTDQTNNKHKQRL